MAASPTLRAVRAAFLLPAAVSMLAGLWLAGTLVASSATTAAAASTGAEDTHGIVMVLGFLGTLIALERAVALRVWWGYLGPAALGAGGVSVLLAVPRLVPQVLLVVGCAVAVAVLTRLSARQGDEPTATQLLAATLALGGALLWTRLDIAALLPWLVGFVVLTVLAERVELARLTMPAHAGRVLLGLAVAAHAAVVAATVWPQAVRGFGAVILVLVGWVARSDVARRTVRSDGLPRFCGAAMLAGYFWLAVAGATWVIGGPPTSQRGYDTVVHASFLGFGMSMVMAHAPIILPAVLRIRLPYRPMLWLPLGLLHIGVLLRIGLGNVAGVHTGWQIGSFTTISALLGFAAASTWTATQPAVDTRDRTTPAVTG